MTIYLKTGNYLHRFTIHSNACSWSSVPLFCKGRVTFLQGRTHFVNQYQRKQQLPPNLTWHRFGAYTSLPYGRIHSASWGLRRGRCGLGGCSFRGSSFSLSICFLNTHVFLFSLSFSFSMLFIFFWALAILQLILFLLLARFVAF